MFKTGYILTPRNDLIWFLGLPFLAIAAAFAAHTWLTAVVLGSVTLWISFPHHFVTWLRTFGFSEDWRRFKDQLIIGPLVILSLAFVGIQWGKMTFAALLFLWDHQHSLMQQHGFARIYDFKARTGTPTTGRWDLALNWFLYGNLLLTAPLYTQFWIREVYRFDYSVSVSMVGWIHAFSWTATAIFLCAYLLHIVRGIRAGYAVNPLKYVFIATSYFLWYFCSWLTISVLVLGIAHRLMHGLQYIVMVYWYLRRKAEHQAGEMNRVLYQMVRPGWQHVLFFIAMCVVYTVTYQVLAGRSLEYFGFGVVSFMTPYKAIPEHGLEAMPYERAWELFIVVVTSSVGLIHYYFDSFIWKVRDTKVQGGL